MSDPRYAQTPSSGERPHTGEREGGEGTTDVSTTVAAVGEQVGEFKDASVEQAKNLVHEATHAIRTQTDEQTKRVVDALRENGDQLSEMAQHASRPDVPVVDATRRLADVTHRAADKLEREGTQGILRDVKTFARHHPGAFLGSAFVLGIAAGRFLRSDVDQHRDGSSSGSEADIELRDRHLQQPTPDAAALSTWEVETSAVPSRGMTP